MLQYELNWFQKEVELYVSLWEKGPTSHLIYCLIRQLPNEFIVSLPRYKSSSVQHDVHFVNCDYDDEAVYPLVQWWMKTCSPSGPLLDQFETTALGPDHLVIDKS